MIKTFSFALMHFSVAFSVAFVLTGDWVIGGLVALVEPAVNTVAYHIHEHLWESHIRQKTQPRPRPLTEPCLCA